jgi:hypothetical protein
MGSHAFENKLIPVDSVNQQPIGLDMAVASANKVASQFVVVQFFSWGVYQTGVNRDVLNLLVHLPFLLHPFNPALSISLFFKLIEMAIQFPLSKSHVVAMTSEVRNAGVMLKGFALLPSRRITSNVTLPFRLERAVDHAFDNAGTSRTGDEDRYGCKSLHHLSAQRFH